MNDDISVMLSELEAHLGRPAVLVLARILASMSGAILADGQRETQARQDIAQSCRLIIGVVKSQLDVTEELRSDVNALIPIHARRGVQ